MKKISILTMGSRGDIQPYVAIALALRDAGYNSIRIITNIDHATFVENYGFEVSSVFPSSQESMDDPVFRSAMAKGDTLMFFKALSGLGEKHVQEISERFLEEMRSHLPDLLINGSLADYYAAYATRFLRVPVVHVKSYTCAGAFDRKRAAFGMQTLPFGLHNVVWKHVVVAGAYNGWKGMDDVTDAMVVGDGKRVTDIISRNEFLKMAVHPPGMPWILTASSLTRDVLYPNADLEKYRFVGACVIEDSKQLSDCEGFGTRESFHRMEEFLKANPSQKPVYCGWGSMTCKSPQYMIVLVVRALKISQQRAIVLAGWAGLSLELLREATQDAKLIQYAKDNILFVDKAPHEWLFPRVACTVHHGGAGTYAAALRSGVPTIVTPVFLDQFDHAHAVSQLGNGIGFSKQLHKISAEELGAAIGKVVKDGTVYSEKARQIKAHALAEAGAAGAVTELEKFWKDYVSTGWYDDMIQSHLRKAGYDSDGNPPRKSMWWRDQRQLVPLVKLCVVLLLVLFPLVLLWAAVKESSVGSDL